MKAPIRRPGVASPAEPCPALSLPGGLSLADVRRKVILETLAANEGNIKGTASVLCISRRSLYPSSPAEPNPPARPRPRVCRLAPPVELPAGLTWPQIRKAVVLAALKANRGRKGATARALGIAPASLFDSETRQPARPAALSVRRSRSASADRSSAEGFGCLFAAGTLAPLRLAAQDGGLPDAALRQEKQGRGVIHPDLFGQFFSQDLFDGFQIFALDKPAIGSRPYRLKWRHGSEDHAEEKAWSPTGRGTREATDHNPRAPGVAAMDGREFAPRPESQRLHR